MPSSAISAVSLGSTRPRREARLPLAESGHDHGKHSVWRAGPPGPSSEVFRDRWLLGRSGSHGARIMQARMEAVPRTIRNKRRRRTPVKFFGQYEDEIYAAGLQGVVPSSDHGYPRDARSIKPVAEDCPSNSPPESPPISSPALTGSTCTCSRPGIARRPLLSCSTDIRSWRTHG